VPPWEAKRWLFQMSATLANTARRNGDKGQEHVLILIDVKKPHLNRNLDEDEWAYIELPEETGGGGRLRRCLYGMRPAASAWEKDYTARLEEVGFARGQPAPTVFFNAGLGVRCVVRGDDFTYLAPRKRKDKIIGDMGAWYDIQVRGIVGSEPEEQKSITILNRELRWEPGKVSLEADPMHARRIVQDMGLEVGSKGLEAPMMKDRDTEPVEVDEEMSPAEAIRFRAIAARANYLGIDRTDVQYAVKEVCRSMAKPKVNSWDGLKRLAWCLLECPRVVWECCDAGKDVDKFGVQ
jgi:hypothetical protein